MIMNAAIFTPQNWILGCEESQEITYQMRKLGHNAWSCDLQDSSGPCPEFHLKMDLFEALKLMEWDGGIFFPPCTHLAVSGSGHFEAKRRDGRQQAAIDFFLRIAGCGLKRFGMENPIGIMSTIWREPDQIIQPHDFGDDASKATCLWLKGLPPLRKTLYIPPRIIDGKPRWANQTDSGQNKLAPSPDRAKIRSKTYPGIAHAMATQWTSPFFYQAELF